jgi:hypothetical protein
MKFDVSLEYYAFWLWAASRGGITRYDKTSIKHVSSCIEMDSTPRQAKKKNRIKTKPVKPVCMVCIATKIDTNSVLLYLILFQLKMYKSCKENTNFYSNYSEP